LDTPVNEALESIEKDGLLLERSKLEDGVKSIWFTLINTYDFADECVAVVEYALPLDDWKVLSSVRGVTVRFVEQIPKKWMIKVERRER
jgi:hypothetical protein